MKHRVLCGLVVALVGCDQHDFVEPLPEVIDVTDGLGGSELVTFREVVDNGTVGNGFRYNGFRYNGFRYNGFRYNGFRYNGVTLNGTTNVVNVVYDSATGALVGEDDSSNPVSLGPLDELVGVGDYDDGAVVSEIKISEVEQFTGGAHPFQFQRVQVRNLESADPDVWGAWDDACLDGADNPTKAILLKGDWSSPTYSRITTTEADLATTWACRGGALAKCVEWGYHPEGVVSSTVLSDHHQACTRLVRADYCGNGDHHTENGTLIDVADSLGIQTHDTTWDIEAAWGADGALCVNDPRKTYWSRTDALTACSSVPSCDANSNADLTDDVAYWFSQGALLVTRNQATALVVEPPAPADSGG